jgi:molecular chaperone DnaK
MDGRRLQARDRNRFVQGQDGLAAPQRGAEKAKIELSSTKDTSINLPYITADASGPKHLQMNLSRARFEQMVADLIERSRKPCLNALKDAGLSPKDIDEVILVGGSTRIPAVQAIVKEIFQKEPHKGVTRTWSWPWSFHQGGSLGGDVMDVLLLDVSPLSLGSRVGVFRPCSSNATTIPPARQDFLYGSRRGDGSVLHVMQGDARWQPEPDLGKFDLVGIPAAPRGVPRSRSPSTSMPTVSSVCAWTWGRQRAEDRIESLRAYQTGNDKMVKKAELTP